jgi:hypothetical protein
MEPPSPIMLVNIAQFAKYCWAAFVMAKKKVDVDARDKPGHDGRHCEERQRRSNPVLHAGHWIASLRSQ